MAKEIRGKILDLDLSKNEYVLNVVLKEKSGNLAVIHMYGNESKVLYRSLKTLCESKENCFSVLVNDNAEKGSDPLTPVSFFRHIASMKQLVEETRRKIHIDFSNDEEEQFSDDQVKAIDRMLELAYDGIDHTFKPNEKTIRTIKKRLTLLGAMSKILSVVKWRELFFETIVNISIDLGFGESVPQALMNAFQNAVSRVLTSGLIKDASK